MMQIDILEVDGKYYGFSGCHRYEVSQMLFVVTCACMHCSKIARGLLLVYVIVHACSTLHGMCMRALDAPVLHADVCIHAHDCRRFSG